MKFCISKLKEFYRAFKELGDPISNQVIELSKLEALYLIKYRSFKIICTTVIRDQYEKLNETF